MKIKIKAAERKSEDVFIKTDFIRHDAFLKFKGIAETGGQAKQLIGEKKLRLTARSAPQEVKKEETGTIFPFSVLIIL